MAQPGARVDLPKPKKFENRVLKSEKTPEGRIPAVKKFQQNIVTKYNFHFNAENELNDAIFSVRQAHKDDYSQLLSFYDHTPAEASGQKEELDSVILKCNNGILLHDVPALIRATIRALASLLIQAICGVMMTFGHPISG